MCLQWLLRLNESASPLVQHLHSVALVTWQRKKKGLRISSIYCLCSCVKCPIKNKHQCYQQQHRKEAHVIWKWVFRSWTSTLRAQKVLQWLRYLGSWLQLSDLLKSFCKILTNNPTVILGSIVILSNSSVGVKYKRSKDNNEYSLTIHVLLQSLQVISSGIKKCWLQTTWYIFKAKTMNRSHYKLLQPWTTDVFALIFFSLNCG